MARLMTAEQLTALRESGEPIPTPFKQRVVHTLTQGEMAAAIRRLLLLRLQLDAQEAREEVPFMPSARFAWCAAHEADAAPEGAAARMLADGARCAPAGDMKEGQYANLVSVLLDDVLPTEWREALEAHAARLEAEERGELPHGGACAATLAGVQYVRTAPA